MTWLDKLAFCNQGNLNILTTQLSKILVQELILSERDYSKFWTPAYKKLSENLWLPTVTDCQDLDLNSSKPLLTKEEECLPLLTMNTKNQQSKNSQKICYPLYISTHVDKWENEVINEKMVKTKMLQLKLTNAQKLIFDKNLQVSNYVYNKTIKYINDNKITTINKLKLRNKLVTLNSKTEDDTYIKFKKYITNLKKQTNLLNKRKLKDIVKLIKLRKRIDYINSVFTKVKKNIKPKVNNDLKQWELDVHKDIRAESVFEACKNINTAKTNVSNGLIKFFEMKYKTKKEGKYSMGLTKAMFKLTDGKFYLTNKDFKGNNKILHFSKRNNKLIEKITNFKDSKIIKKQGKYYLALAVENKQILDFKTNRVIGIDPGVRTFLTCYSEDHGIEYKFNNNLTDKLDKLKSILKNKHNLRKRTLTKIDKRKENVINELHWKSINHLVKNYDVIIIEKFDSQGFVKGGKNKTLNRRTNNLKPYLFRQRLLYKAECYNKEVLVVNSHYTTKTCSNCGNQQDIGMSKIYDCKKCNQVLERDFNAAKNILMKGLLG